MIMRSHEYSVVNRLQNVRGGQGLASPTLIHPVEIITFLAEKQLFRSNKRREPCLPHADIMRKTGRGGNGFT